MATPKKVWLARDDHLESVYKLFSTKPKKSGTGRYYPFGKSGCQITVFCAHDFERITSFKLEPGERIRVQFPVKIV